MRPTNPLAATRLAPLPLLLTTLVVLLLCTSPTLAAPRARATRPPALRRRDDPTGYTFQVTVTVHVTVPITVTGEAAAGGGGGGWGPSEPYGLPGLPRAVSTDVVAVATVVFTPPAPAPAPTVVVVTQWATDVATEDVTDYEWVTEAAPTPETTAPAEWTMTTPEETPAEETTAEETPAEETPVDEGTVEQYQQCGGVNWSGGTSCVSPWQCSTLNDYYAQCL